MKLVLTVTRFLIAVATSLHLKSLSGTIALGERRVAKAMRATDTASTVHSAAVATMSETARAKRIAKAAEKAAARDQAALRAAAIAEADTLRRDHAVGA